MKNFATKQDVEVSAQKLKVEMIKWMTWYFRSGLAVMVRGAQADLISTALYKEFIEVGASEESASKAAEDVIQVSQLPQLATKADIAGLEARLIKWMVGSLFAFCHHHHRRHWHTFPNPAVPRSCSVSCKSEDGFQARFRML